MDVATVSVKRQGKSERFRFHLLVVSLLFTSWVAARAQPEGVPPKAPETGRALPRCVASEVSAGNRPLKLGGKATLLHLDLSAQPKQFLQPIDLGQIRQPRPWMHVGPVPASLRADAPEALFTQGLERLANRDIPAALNAFERCVANTLHPLALYRLGERLMAVEMLPLALRAFEHAGRQDPRLAAFVSKRQAEIQQYGTLPDLLWPTYLNALGLELSGDSIEAAGAFERVVTAAPNFIPARLHLSRLNEGNAAIRLLLAGLERAPEHTGLLEALGDALMRQKQFSMAEERYTQAEKMAKKSLRAGAADSGLENSLLYPQLGRLHEKQRLAHGAHRLKRHSCDATGWVLAGQGLHGLGQIEEAEKAFRNAVIVRPGIPDALAELFARFLETANWNALAGYESALQPWAHTHAGAARMLGLYRLRQRRYPEAISLLEQSHRLAPRHVAGMVDLADAYERMAVYLQMIGEKPQTDIWRMKAASVLREGIQKTRSPWLQLRLGQLYLKQHRLTDALERADNLIRQNPLDAQAHLLKAAIHYERLETEVAETALKDVLALDPDNADTLVLTGLLAMASGDKVRAIRLYREAHRLNPLSTSAMDALLQSGAPGVQSSLKHPLNADEREALIQALLLDCRAEDLHREFLKHRSVWESGNATFGLRFFRDLQQAREWAHAMCVRQRELARQASQIRPPLRLSLFHERLARLFRLDAECYERWTRDISSGFHTAGESAEIVRQRQADDAEHATCRHALLTAGREILRDIPAMDAGMILREAGLEDVSEWKKVVSVTPGD